MPRYWYPTRIYCRPDPKNLSPKAKALFDRTVSRLSRAASSGGRGVNGASASAMCSASARACTLNGRDDGRAFDRHQGVRVRRVRNAIRFRGGDAALQRRSGRASGWAHCALARQTTAIHMVARGPGTPRRLLAGDRRRAGLRAGDAGRPRSEAPRAADGAIPDAGCVSRRVPGSCDSAP